MRMLTNRCVMLVGLFVGLLAAGSAAHAAPGHRKAAAEAAPCARAAADTKAASRADADADAGDAADAADAAADVPAATTATRKRLAEAKDEAARDDAADAKPRTAPSSGWTFAVGPYAWASSVAIEASFGSLTTGVELDFLTLARHARLGAEVVLEARRGRFGISGDIMYGEAGFEGSTEIASVMTTVTGKASSLLLDGVLSYAVIGSEDAAFLLEPRAGVRYQRTTVQAEVGAGGFMLQTPEIAVDGADVIVGARGAVRPVAWLQLAGAFDVGVAGASDSTWSTTIEATARVSSWASLTAGWRSLTLQQYGVKQQMQGPRFALQFLF